jgi:hypothetical protein
MQLRQYLYFCTRIIRYIYVYIFTYMYMYMYMYIYRCMYMYMYVYRCMYIASSSWALCHRFRRRRRSICRYAAASAPIYLCMRP